jgi:hypothetical protein
MVIKMKPSVLKKMDSCGSQEWLPNLTLDSPRLTGADCDPPPKFEHLSF